MRAFKRALKIIGIVLVVFVALIGVAVGLIWSKPDLVVNETNIQRALSYLKPNLQASWDRLTVKITPHHWNGKHVQLDSKNLCVKWKTLVDTCIEDINFDFSFSLASFFPELVELNSVNVSSSFLTVDLPKNDKPKKPTQVPRLSLPSFKSVFPQKIPFEKIGILNFKIDEFKLKMAGDDPYEGTLSASKKTQGNEGFLIVAQSKISKGKGFSTEVETSWSIPQDKTRLEMNGQLKVGLGTTQFSTPLNLQWQDELELTALPNLKTPTIVVKTPLSLQANAEQWSLRLGEIKLQNLWSRAALHLENCSLFAKTPQPSGHLQNLSSGCDVRIVPRNWREKLGLLLVHVQANVPIDYQGSDTAHGVAQVTASGDHPLLDGKVNLTSEFFLNLADFSFNKPPTLAASSDLAIPEYEKWVKLFSGTSIAIPAPVNTLKGKISLHLQTEQFEKGDETIVQANLATELSDFRQRLRTLNVAKIILKGPALKPHAVDLDLDLNLKEIRLEAPPLRLTTLPQLMPDKRFISESKITKKSTLPITWRVYVHNENPILVDSNLFKSAIPLSVNLKAAYDGQPDGNVQVLSMPVEIFGKKAQVENIKISYLKDSRTSGLNGSVLYQTPEVKIHIQFLGTTERPRVELISEPPLTRQQILSVLLYNKSLDELSEEEANTAGNMSKAFSDGAFGLFSLVFLSSTPIQSVSYDPTTGAYSARVKVDDGTTLAVSSDFEQSRQYTLRRRLGGPWAIRTELREQENEPDVVVTLLEWFKRF